MQDLRLRVQGLGFILQDGDAAGDFAHVGHVRECPAFQVRDHHEVCTPSHPQRALIDVDEESLEVVHAILVGLSQSDVDERHGLARGGLGLRVYGPKVQAR